MLHLRYQGLMSLLMELDEGDNPWLGLPGAMTTDPSLITNLAGEGSPGAVPSHFIVW